MAIPAATRKTRPDAAASTPPTRELILDTAERLFSARGVDGVAVRDLAREMHITASSLYNHFPSKQALYDAVVERGVGPIIEMVGASWRPGALRPEDIQASVDRLTAHLARHPHLACLLQRALMEDSAALQALLERWIGVLYREGVGVLRQTAREAGWEASELPHLTMALYGMIFAYFTNPVALQRLAGWSDEPLSARALTTQRRFLEQAIYRLIGPRPKAATNARTKTRASRDARRRHS